MLVLDSPQFSRSSGPKAHITRNSIDAAIWGIIIIIIIIYSAPFTVKMRDSGALQCHSMHTQN